LLPSTALCLGSCASAVGEQAPTMLVLRFEPQDDWGTMAARVCALYPADDRRIIGAVPIVAVMT